MFPPGLGYADVTGRQGRNALALPPPCPLLRVQGPVPAVYRQCVLAYAGTRQVIAYHCVLAHAGAPHVSACHCVLAPAGAPHVSACHCEPVRTLVWQSVLLRQHKPKSSACGESAAACALTPVPPSCTRAHLPTFCMSLRPCTRRRAACFCMSLRTSAHTGVAIRSPAAAQTEKQSFGRIRNRLRIHPGTTLLHPRTPAHLLHVIARSEATWQSVLLAAAQNEKQSFGRIRKVLRIRLKYY